VIIGVMVLLFIFVLVVPFLVYDEQFEQEGCI